MTKSLSEKLSKIRKDISVTKNGVNSYGGYNYYQLDDIYAAIKKVFADNKIFTTFEQEPCGKTLADQRDSKEEGLNTVTHESQMVKSILTVYDGESSDTFTFSNISEMNRGKGMQAAQNAGANVTYQAKYAYSTLLMLDDGADDPDAPKKEKKTSKATTNNDNFEL